MLKSWNFTLVLLSFCSLLWISSCGNATDSSTDSSADTMTEAAESGVEAAVDTLSEFGRIKSVEDGVYPMYNLVIEFPERQFSETFLLNAEEIRDLDLEKLSNSVGKYISFQYTSEFENALLELKYNGKSLLDFDDPFEPIPEIKTIEGILKNAGEPTKSDLPDQISISAADGASEKFDYYITPKIAKANGKKVLAYYEIRTANRIIGLEFRK